MRKMTFTLSYDAERLTALRLYLEQKKISLEEELTAALDMLYAKTVPGNVRDFICLRTASLKTEDRKPKSHASVAEQPVKGGGDD